MKCYLEKLSDLNIIYSWNFLFSFFGDEELSQQCENPGVKIPNARTSFHKQELIGTKAQFKKYINSNNERLKQNKEKTELPFLQ